MTSSHLFRPFRRAVLMGGVLLAVMGGGNVSAAQADVKIVQRATAIGLEEILERLSGGDVEVLDTTYVTYYKGDKFRQDSPNLDVVYIYDADTDKFYTLNQSDRTYSVRPLGKVLIFGFGSGATNSVTKINRTMKAEGSSTLMEGGAKRSIAGKTAKDYTVGAEMVVEPSTAGTPRMGLASIKVEGQHWTSDALTLPSKNPRLKRLGYFPGQMILRNIMSPLGDRMEEMTGTPLSYDVILTITMNTPRGPETDTFQVQSDVKLISTKPLPASLFKVPAGYRLVARVREDLAGARN